MQKIYAALIFLTHHNRFDLSIELSFCEIVDRPAEFFLVALEADFGAELDGYPVMFMSNLKCKKSTFTGIWECFSIQTKNCSFLVFFWLIKFNFFLSWSSSISFGSFIRFSIFMQTAFVLLTLAQARGYLPLRIYGPVGSTIQVRCLRMINNS